MNKMQEIGICKLIFKHLSQESGTWKKQHLLHAEYSKKLKKFLEFLQNFHSSNEFFLYKLLPQETREGPCVGNSHTQFLLEFLCYGGQP